MSAAELPNPGYNHIDVLDETTTFHPAESTPPIAETLSQPAAETHSTEPVATVSSALLTHGMPEKASGEVLGLNERGQGIVDALYEAQDEQGKPDPAKTSVLLQGLTDDEARDLLKVRAFATPAGEMPLHTRGFQSGQPNPNTYVTFLADKLQRNLNEKDWQYLDFRANAKSEPEVELNSAPTQPPSPEPPEAAAPAASTESASPSVSLTEADLAAQDLLPERGNAVKHRIGAMALRGIRWVTSHFNGQRRAEQITKPLYGAPHDTPPVPAQTEPARAETVGQPIWPTVDWDALQQPQVTLEALPSDEAGQQAWIAHMASQGLMSRVSDAHLEKMSMSAFKSYLKALSEEKRRGVPQRQAQRATSIIMVPSPPDPHAHPYSAWPRPEDRNLYWPRPDDRT